MPFLRMKTKISMDSLREKKFPRVCQTSVNSERPFCQPKFSSVTGELETFALQSVHSGTETCYQYSDTNKGCDMVKQASIESQMQVAASVDTGSMERKESSQNGLSNVETIFSPLPEPAEAHVGSEIQIEPVPGISIHTDAARWEAGQSGVSRSTRDSNTCNLSDCFISDVIIASLPCDENGPDDVFTGINPLPDYICAEPGMFFDMAEKYMILPFLEDKTADLDYVKSHESNMVDHYRGDFCLASDQTRFHNTELEVNLDSDQLDDFDPLLFIKTLPELSDVISNFHPTMLPKDNPKKKLVTLVLDLDETLVRSTLEHREDADFTFNVFFNMKEHTVYVKQRPYLHVFLEKVAAMFEVIIFTASQSIYAAQLLDILDPDRKFISRRVYRESCILCDGIYTKDLTVLGVDLAKVAIIDNSPQVFRFQVNNGIPIKSWFDDPSDDALISLLPFLETLSVADDVRPIIAKRFGNKE